MVSDFTGRFLVALIASVLSLAFGALVGWTIHGARLESWQAAPTSQEPLQRVAGDIFSDGKSLYSLLGQVAGQLIEVRCQQDGGPLASGSYYKDDTHVVYSEFGHAGLIALADPKSFSLQFPTSPGAMNWDCAFARDGRESYFRGVALHLRPDDIVLLSGDSAKECAPLPYVVAGDGEGRRFVYVIKAGRAVKMPDALPESFQVLSSGYAKDDHHVYLDDDVTTLEPGSFDEERALTRCGSESI